MVRPWNWLICRLEYALAVLVISALMWGAIYPPPAHARVDSYVVNYLNVRDPIELPYNDSGQSIAVTAEELSQGKRLFEQNCLNCHVGGATLPNPSVTLSMSSLEGATPPRNTVSALMAYQREPMTYDGFEESYECRKVSEGWLEDAQLQDLSAFILKAAQTAPGWGTNIMENE